MSKISEFRKRLLAGEALIGTWVKTPSHIVVEVLGRSSLDCICVDAEHAPFDRMSIDAAVLASQGVDMPLLVRVPGSTPEQILNALDCGCNGIVAPHIQSPEAATELVQFSHYGPGGRGFAGSSRFASYGQRILADQLELARQQTTVIAQIEDIPAVKAIDEIVEVEGVDCLFIGRIDLTVALGAKSPADKKVVEAVERVCRSAKNKNRRVGMFVSDMQEIPKWRSLGASLFILKSDHSFLLKGANQLAESFKSLN